MIDTAISHIDRDAVESAIVRSVGKFKRKPSFDWIRRGESKFLRVTVKTVIVEIRFFDTQIEVWAAMPFLFKLIFTEKLKKGLMNEIERAISSVNL